MTSMSAEASLADKLSEGGSAEELLLLPAWFASSSARLRGHFLHHG